VLNAVTCLREVGVNCRGLVTSVRFNHVGREIAAQAQRLDADLIVMGTRNLSCLAQWLCGSVSRDTTHGARCPVTLVR
jgi:nucleotide-binding universal stress UspA family protein